MSYIHLSQHQNQRMRSIILFGFSLLLHCSLAQPSQGQSPLGKRFAVDDVKMADSRLDEMNAQDAFEKQLGKEIAFFPDELKDTKVAAGWGNCLVSTIHTSFDEHRPLSLSPDVIWLAICQGISIHINQHFEALKPQIFKLDKPHKIVVRNDNLSDGSVHWADLLHNFSDTTTKYVKDDYYSFFVPKFSTTTNIEMTSYEITMLEGFSQAFEYFGDSGCGIPYITLRGTREDWEAINNRLDKIDELGLTLWAQELRSVVDQFIQVYDGNIDLDFWQDIYKDHDEYGGSYVSGWFIKLFPYLERTGEIEPANDPDGVYYSRAPKIYVANPFLKGDQYLVSRLTVNDFPSGIAEITVHWDNYGKKREMKVHAGFFGMKQYDDLSLEPAIAWAVRDKEGAEAYYDQLWKNEQVEHRKVYWSPNTDYPLVTTAFYDPSSHADSLKNDSFLKRKISAHITQNTPYSLSDLEGKTIELLISSKGTYLELKGDQLDKSLLDEVNKLMHSLPKKWQPATADFRHFAFDYYDENDDGSIVPIAANSWVRLTF